MRPSHLSRWVVPVTAGILVGWFIARPTLRASQPSATIASAMVAGSFGGKPSEADKHADAVAPLIVHLKPSPMSAEAHQTHLKLMEEHLIHFPTAVSLEEVKKYIERVTADEEEPDSGLAVYFDPQGLQDVDKTMASTVSLDFKKPIRLGRSLELLLKQVNLKYQVADDGMLVITSNSDDDDVTIEEQTLSEINDLRNEIAALRVDLARHKGEIPAGQAGGGQGGMGGGGFR